MDLERDLITTVVGSYPSVPSKESLSRSRHHMEDPFQESLERAVRAQSEAGIELLSDGQTRKGMVRLFAEGLHGFRIKEKVEMISEVYYRGSITVEDQNRVRSMLSPEQGVKGVITGPWTLFKSSDNRFYDDEKKAVLDIANALKEEAESLAPICDVIQLDEPYLSIEYPDFAREMVETVLDIETTTALHVCGDVHDIVEGLVEIDVDILDHEFAANPSLYDVYDEIDTEKRMAAGVVTTDPELEDIGTITQRIKRAQEIFGPKAMVDPDCGLRNLTEKKARKKLENMVKARDVVLDEAGR